jgi:hypothetical protein
VRQIYRHMVGEVISRGRTYWGVHSHPELAAINAGVQHKTLRDSDPRARGSDQA